MSCGIKYLISVSLLSPLLATPFGQQQAVPTIQSEKSLIMAVTDTDMFVCAFLAMLFLMIILACKKCQHSPGMPNTPANHQMQQNYRPPGSGAYPYGVSQANYTNTGYGGYAQAPDRGPTVENIFLGTGETAVYHIDVEGANSKKGSVMNRPPIEHISLTD